MILLKLIRLIMRKFYRGCKFWKNPLPYELRGRSPVHIAMLRNADQYAHLGGDNKYGSISEAGNQRENQLRIEECGEISEWDCSK